MAGSDWALVGGISAVALGVGIPLTLKEWRAVKALDIKLAALPG